MEEAKKCVQRIFNSNSQFEVEKELESIIKQLNTHIEMKKGNLAKLIKHIFTLLEQTPSESSNFQYISIYKLIKYLYNLAITHKIREPEIILIIEDLIYKGEERNLSTEAENVRKFSRKNLTMLWTRLIFEFGREFGAVSRKAKYFEYAVDGVELLVEIWDWIIDYIYANMSNEVILKAIYFLRNIIYIKEVKYVYFYL